MLEELLRLVADGGIHSYADLAEALDVPGALLEQMLDDLARMGYLRRASGGCPGYCAHCPQANLCAVGGHGKIWALTERGSNLAKRQSSPRGDIS